MIVQIFGPEAHYASWISVGVDWISKAICRIGKAAGVVVERVVQGLRESFELRADWQRLLEQRIDQERFTLEEAVIEIEGDPWEHWEARVLPVEGELLVRQVWDFRTTKATTAEKILQ